MIKQPQSIEKRTEQKIKKRRNGLKIDIWLTKGWM